MKRDITTLIYGFVFLVMTAALYWHTFSMDFADIGQGIAYDPLFFPRVLIGLMAFFALVMIGQALAHSGPAKQAFRWGLLAALVALIAAYFFGLRHLGFVISSLVFMACFITALGYRRWPVLVAVAALFPLFIWWVFYAWLEVPVPNSSFSQII